jgi:alpha-ketoglutarate-dependent taurine dioxygenase
MSNDISELSVQPLDKSFGAVLTGIRLAELDDESFARLYEAWLSYALLIFPQQHLSDDEQIAFAKRFGDLVEGLEAAEISNVKPDGTLRDAPDDDMMKIIRGNMHWHQDNTYMPIQAKGAVFSAKTVPTAQGDTAFADMRAAWSALDESTRQRLMTLSAHHSLAHSQKLLGEETKSDESEYIGYGLDVADVPLRPLVKIHPETGVPSLAVGRHAYGVTGLSASESDALLAGLIEFAVSDDSRVYQHRWQSGDVVVWDNRCLMHRACPWNYDEPRVMLHSRIAGDPETESALSTA